jgi:hypothetical protein
VADRDVQASEQTAGERLILVPWRVLGAPGVEAPGDAGKLTIGTAYEGRAGVSDPGIVDWELDHLGMIAELLSRVARMLRVGDHGDGLERGDGAGNCRISLLHVSQPLTIETQAMWPGHERPLSPIGL